MSRVNPESPEIDFRKLFLEIKEEIPFLFKRALQISLLASSVIVSYIYCKPVPATLFSALLLSACYIGEKLQVPFIRFTSCFSSLRPFLESLLYEKCPSCGGYKKRMFVPI